LPTLDDIVSAFAIETLAVGQDESLSANSAMLKIKDEFPAIAGILN
jgi:hypothetical protein